MRLSKFIIILLASVLTGGLLLYSSPPSPPPSPQIVASATLLNQVGSVPLTTIYTPTSSGVFHVSGYAVFTNSSFGTSGISITLQWVDELQTESFIYCTSPPGTNPGYCQGDEVIHAIANQPIQFTTGPAMMTTPFDLYVVVIKE